MSVSIVFPCFNPPKDWSQNIIACYKELQNKIKDEIEIIIVQDGDQAGITNRDIDLLRDNISHFQFISYPENKGKGYAIKQGVKTSNGNIILYTDIDIPYTIESIYSIYSALNNNECDLAAGVKNKNYYSKVPFSRRIISNGFRRLIRLFISIPFTDTQCGLKGFNNKLKPIILATTIDRYLFDLEFIRSAYKQGYKITPITIDLREGIHFRKINYRILFPELFNFIKLLLK